MWKEIDGERAVIIGLCHAEQRQLSPCKKALQRKYNMEKPYKHFGKPAEAVIDAAASPSAPNMARLADCALGTARLSSHPPRPLCEFDDLLRQKSCFRFICSSLVRVGPSFKQGHLRVK